jgi:lipoprotein-releasing system permease protein
MYFVQDPPRVRPFIVSGIYNTGLEEFDKLYVLGDISHIQKLNNWETGKAGGYEIVLNDFKTLEKSTEMVNATIGYDLIAKSTKQLNPQIFDWLKLQDTNVYILITLMLLVSIINMITALIVLILERTNTIGILKTLGATDWSIRKIFLYNAVYLLGLGLLLGNILGIGLCFFQQITGFITLPQESYYVSQIPVNLEIKHLILLNAGTIVICTAMMIIPTKIISKIYPIKAIRFN